MDIYFNLCNVVWRKWPNFLRNENSYAYLATILILVKQSNGSVMTYNKSWWVRSPFITDSSFHHNNVGSLFCTYLTSLYGQDFFFLGGGGGGCYRFCNALSFRLWLPLSINCLRALSTRTFRHFGNYLQIHFFSKTFLFWFEPSGMSHGWCGFRWLM